MTLLNDQMNALNAVVMEPSRSEVERKCHELIAKGNALFGTHASLSDIRWDLCGNNAGMACNRNWVYHVRFNLEAKRLDPVHFFNETVPHEIAHIIVFELKRMGRSADRGHGRDFKRVCRALGGQGNRCHNIELTPARKRKKYKYVADSGREIHVGSVIHNKIQKGQGRRFRDTGERITHYHYAGMA